MASETISPAKKMAIQGLVLTTFSQGKVPTFINEIRFLFRGIRQLETNFQKKLKEAIQKEKNLNSGLSHTECVDLVFSNKKTMIKLIEFKRKEAIYAQCIILQVSTWIKSSYKAKIKILSDYSGKSEISWKDKILKLGPKYNKSWVNSIDVASNYVRHKDEWRYNSYDFEKGLKLIARKNVIGTMKVGKPRKNAQFLVDLKIPQSEIFGIGKDASMAILEKVSSDKLNGLEKNCKEWITELNKFTEKELMRLISDL